MMMATLLQAEGYEVRTVEDGQKAKDILATDPTGPS
jgi:DNA-binding response OmpR family regulator